jgi:hypothetical protein
MQKPRLQSTQAPFVPLFCMKLFLFSNTIQTFLKQLFWWIPTWTGGQNTPWCKDITKFEHKSRQKSKPKHSSRKREHSLNDKSEKWSVLGKWKAMQLLQKKLLGSNHLLQQTKLKTKTTDAPRKTHSAWSNKNIGDFYFRALKFLVVLSFPQLLSFSSVFPKPLSETLRRSSDGRIPV